ncbi:MAG: hypothetical protein K6C97_05620 [Treponema sp.]|nr:hypothetical protein [Treponema sp.]
MRRIEELEKRISQLETAFSKLKCVQQMQLSEQNRNYAKLKETAIFFLKQGWSVGDIAKGLRRSESEINRLIGH